MAASYEGRTFGRFQIIARVGAGGMGEVYRAHDSHLKRDVAIKFLQAGSGGDRRLMEREAHALSRLNHPNIATVHDLLHQEGVDFVVMEFIDGTSLAERLKAGRIPEDARTAIATQIAAGLREAHEHGVVHRDLKPGNVMLTARGQVKLVDFGLAAHKTPVEGDAATETYLDPGRTAGTLPYMAPEQIAGEATDPRTDIWAFGVVLYEMATGRLPFTESNPMLLAERILNREPPAPGTIDPSIPPWLDAVIVKALQKSPADRFQSVGDMAAALARRDGAGAPVSAPARRPGGRRRWRMAALGAAAVLVASAGVIGWWLLGGGAGAPAQRLSVLVGDTVNRTGDPTFDQIVAELLTTSLEQSRFVSIYPRTRAAFVLQLMKQPPDAPIDEAVGREICQREGLASLLTSQVARLGDAYVLLLRLEDPTGRLLSSARQQFTDPSELPARIDAAVRAVRTNLGESAASIRASSAPLAQVTSSSLEAVRLYTRGRQRLLAGDPNGAIALMQKALEVDPNFAMALEGIGVAYTNLRDMGRAEQYIGRAAGLADRVPEVERHKILGDYGMLRRDYEDACPHLEVLTELRPLDPVSFLELGVCKSFQFDNAAAVADTRRAIAMQPTFRYRVNLARFQFLAGDAKDALALANKLRAEVPSALQAQYVAGQPELALGHLDDARKTYQTMVGLGGAAEPEGHVGLADLDLATGRTDEAVAELERGWAAASRVGNVQTAGHAATALAEVALAGHHTADFDRAIDRLRSLKDPVVHYLLVRTLARAGRVDEAAALLPQPDADAPAADKAIAAMLHAEIDLARKDTANAMREADQAWGFEPSVLARETQARAYAAAGQRAEAAGFYADVLKRQDERIDFYDAPGFHRVIDDEYRLGVLLDELGRPEDAKPHLERVVATMKGAGASSPEYADAVKRLGTGD
jgi:tetratricopeptide (TPR) repeat protein/predicted Ser/Thr protein kinase